MLDFLLDLLIVFPAHPSFSRNDSLQRYSVPSQAEHTIGGQIPKASSAYTDYYTIPFVAGLAGGQKTKIGEHGAN